MRQMRRTFSKPGLIKQTSPKLDQDFSAAQSRFWRSNAASFKFNQMGYAKAQTPA
jgi:hypothetical protein